MRKNMDLSQWLKENLQEVLPCLVSDDVVEYVKSIEDFRDLEDYMKTLTDTSSPKYKEFVAKYKKVRRSVRDVSKDSDDEYKVKQKNKKKGGSFNNLKDKKCPAKEVKTKEVSAKENEKQGQKKKTKFINLYSAEGKQKDVIFLKGRHLCECQASKHKLVNNCLKCGRIVCEQEGKGPCLFCEAMVYSKEDLEIINSNSRQSRKLYNSIMQSFKSEELDKAMERRDKLLEYDKTFAQRTKVIDDEGEYFSSNSVWLSKEEREKLQKKEEEALARKHASKLMKKFTLDFAGRAIVEDDPAQYDEDFLAEAMSNMEASLAERHSHPDMCDMLELSYESPNSVRGGTAKRVQDTKSETKLVTNRVQDRELLEMSDNGVCLSLHQPWASLLVSGIMRYEGRTWYTSHRGRLWIASASKQPTEQDITDAERFFQEVRAGENLTFPKSYPTGCLLGCVSVTDCLPQEEFRSRFPDGECDSPFVFVCEDPQRLDTLFPVSGSHKLYKLDPKIHQASNKVLLRMAKKANL